MQQGAPGKRRTRQEAAAVRDALAQGQTVAFATRHQWRHYTQRKPLSAVTTDGKPYVTTATNREGCALVTRAPRVVVEGA